MYKFNYKAKYRFNYKVIYLYNSKYSPVKAYNLLIYNYVYKNKMLLNNSLIYCVWNNFFAFISNIFKYTIFFFTFTDNFLKYENMSLNWFNWKSSFFMWKYAYPFFSFKSIFFSFKVMHFFSFLKIIGASFIYLSSVAKFKIISYYAKMFKLFSIGVVTLNFNPWYYTYPIISSGNLININIYINYLFIYYINSLSLNVYKKKLLYWHT